MAGVSVRAASDAPKLVCRRSREPKTRRLFDSSEPRDVSEPVLLCWRRFCMAGMMDKGVLVLVLEVVEWTQNLV